MRTHIAVLTGGSTGERDVALSGAGEVTAALRRLGHSVTVIDTASGPLDARREASLLGGAVARQPPSAETLRALATGEDLAALTRLDALTGADLVFIVLHGEPGEGGRVQAVLELAGLRYVGSDSLGSMLAMDKDIAKRLMRDAGVATPDGLRWPRHGTPSEAAIAALGLPLVVKPSRVGSSVGLSVVDELAGLEAAVVRARRHDPTVLVEAFIAGRELSVGVLGDQPLAVGEIRPRHRIFDYECKYTPGMTEEIFPAAIDDALAERLQALALAVHEALRLRHVSRIDFRLDAKGAPYCLEANTLPGMTSASLLPQSAAAAGISFDGLVERLCRLALEQPI